LNEITFFAQKEKKRGKRGNSNEEDYGVFTKKE